MSANPDHLLETGAIMSIVIREINQTQRSEVIGKPDLLELLFCC